MPSCGWGLAKSASCSVNGARRRPVAVLTGNGLDGAYAERLASRSNSASRYRYTDIAPLIRWAGKSFSVSRHIRSVALSADACGRRAHSRWREHCRILGPMTGTEFKLRRYHRSKRRHRLGGLRREDAPTAAASAPLRGFPKRVACFHNSTSRKTVFATRLKRPKTTLVQIIGATYRVDYGAFSTSEVRRSRSI